MKKGLITGLIVFQIVFVLGMGFPWPAEAIRREHDWIRVISPYTGLYQWWSMFSTTGRPGTSRDYSAANARSPEGRARIPPGFWISVRLEFETGQSEEWPVPQCLPGGDLWEQFRQVKTCAWVRTTLQEMALNQTDGPVRSAAVLIGNQAKAKWGRKPVALRIIAVPLDWSRTNPVQSAREKALEIGRGGKFPAGRADYLRYWPEFAHLVQFRPDELK